MKMSNLKNDFPLLMNNPELIYLDSTATSQKPDMVLDGVREYLSNSYANIHRGSYSLSEISETLYENSKKKLAFYLGSSNWREIIYSYNATYALNLIASSLKRSKKLKKGDKVLLSIVEHHANIVPWLILKEEIGIEIDYIKIKDDYSLDLEDLKSKLDANIKVVSITHVSNVTGEIFDLESVGKILKHKYGTQNYGGNGKKIIDIQKDSESFQFDIEGFYNKPLFIVDASQSVPHFKVDVKKLQCDFLFFTGHKVMAEGGIGVLWAKKEHLDSLKPAFCGGGAIHYVKTQKFQENASLPEKWEPGTPNLNGAISLLKAFEYIENIGGYEKIESIENTLISYTLSKFKNYPSIKIIGSQSHKNRVGVFSFVIAGIHSHDIAEMLAENDICIRAGQHCAEPFIEFIGESNTCRMSLYIYNSIEEIDKFFINLDQIIKEFRV